MGYDLDREEAMRQIQADPELAAALAEDERLCAAAERVALAARVIRMTYAATNEEVNRYELTMVRDEAWRVVAQGLSTMRGYRVSVVAVPPITRCSGVRTTVRYKVVRA